LLREIENQAIRRICRQNKATLGTAALYVCDAPLPSRNRGKDQRHNETAGGRNQDVALPPLLSVPAGGICGE
jgi:hypothetical protein